MQGSNTKFTNNLMNVTKKYSYSESDLRSQTLKYLRILSVHKEIPTFHLGITYNLNIELLNYFHKKNESLSDS